MYHSDERSVSTAIRLKSVLKYSFQVWTKTLSDMQFVILRTAIRYNVNMVSMSGHVHIILYRFLFRFIKLYGMMWTHFPFNIYVEYEFKNFGHYFNVFWCKKQPSEKKTRESKAIDSNNKRMSKVLKINFVLSDDEIQFLHSLANSNFGCYCSRSS